MMADRGGKNLEHKSILLVAIYLLMATAYAYEGTPQIRLFIEGPTDEFSGTGCTDSVSYLIRVYNIGTDSTARNLDINLFGMNLQVADYQDWLGNMGAPYMEVTAPGSSYSPDWAMTWYVGDLKYEEERDLLVTFCKLDDFTTISGSAWFEGALDAVNAEKREWMAV